MATNNGNSMPPSRAGCSATHAGHGCGCRYGDQALMAVGRALNRGLRRTDLPAHVGGDEFAMIPWARIPHLYASLLGSTLALIAVLMVACAPPLAPGQSSKQTGPASVAEMRLVASEWKFDPPLLRLPTGRSITLTLENKGQVEHDLEVESLGLHLHAMPGEAAQATFRTDKPGTYEFVCTLPGHKEAGMTGTLVVGTGVAEAKQASQPKPATTALAAAPKPAAVLDFARLPQAEIAPPIAPRAPAIVPIEIEARERTAMLDDGVAYTFWTFGGSVPGPMLRVRQGDTVVLTFKNAADSKLTHSIDLHAVNGPGGGARATQMAPGQQSTFRFQALNPGVYVYHCATPMVAHHIASGMYGLIVVEPPQGLPRVDREFYVMQGDFYLQGARGQKGLRDVSIEKLLDERPDYVLFNGGVGALAKDNALRAKVGETVRIFFGVGGPNLTSSFHVIGEIFDRVFPEGASEPLTNVQTTLVPAGGAAITEFKLDVPGSYLLVDHSLSRLEKGAVAILEVDGPQDQAIFHAELGQALGGGASGH